MDDDPTLRIRYIRRSQFVSQSKMTSMSISGQFIPANGKFAPSTNNGRQARFTNWRDLSSFGGEQVQDTYLDAEFGAVVPGDVTGTIELQGRINQAQVHEFGIKNPFMGFSDFRARFTSMTNPADWTVSPTEGSLNGRSDPTQFIVKFRPNSRLSQKDIWWWRLKTTSGRTS